MVLNFDTCGMTFRELRDVYKAIFSLNPDIKQINLYRGAERLHLIVLQDEVTKEVAVWSSYSAPTTTNLKKETI